jgi:AcrR family transcriptional regulator
MGHREETQQQMINLTAEYILEKGLYELSLRPLAKYLGTSDRMILHYFRTKDELVRQSLSEILHRTIGLVNLKQTEKIGPSEFIKMLPSIIKDPQLRPYFRLWIELASYQKTRLDLGEDYVQEMIGRIRSWIKEVVDLPENEYGHDATSFLLLVIEGSILLDSYAQDPVIEEAQKWMLENLNLP